MAALKKLASQTAIYGLSSIVGRFLNYLLVPLYTYHFPAESYGIVSEFYAYAGFFSVVLVMGLETGYFRFRHDSSVDPESAYASGFWAIFVLNALFLGLLVGFARPLSGAIHYTDHPEYLIWFGCILSMDAISALPFARLRAEGKALQFAGIKLVEIALTIGLNLFFLIGAPLWVGLWPESPALSWYEPSRGVGYIFLANLMASAIKLVLLLPQLRVLFMARQALIMGPMLRYSLPMVLIGLAGMVNEMLDRAVLKYLLPFDVKSNLRLLGIYGACYKLSILMSLFVQAFRYAAEPFFFARKNHQDAKQTYAQVMRYFVVCCSLIFLFVTVFIDYFQYFVGAEYREGLSVVPILLMANLFLGIYVNLSIWYKLTDRTWMGGWVSLLGAAATVILNLWWVPAYGYVGAAWSTLVCYAGMALISWRLGQVFYPVPYPVMRLFAYLLLAAFLAWLHQALRRCGLESLIEELSVVGGYLAIVMVAEAPTLLRRSNPGV